MVLRALLWVWRVKTCLHADMHSSPRHLNGREAPSRHPPSTIPETWTRAIHSRDRRGFNHQLSIGGACTSRAQELAVTCHKVPETRSHHPCHPERAGGWIAPGGPSWTRTHVASYSFLSESELKADFSTGYIERMYSLLHVSKPVDTESIESFRPF